MAARKTDMSAYFKAEDPIIDVQAREILSRYSNVPEDEHVNHVKSIRDKAWETFPYPCVGLYSFVNFSIAQSSAYPEVLRRLKDENTNLLDLACGLGQDIRKLVYDGVPAEKLCGSELEAGFVDLGYDLFLDKEYLKATMLAGDFFSEELGGLKDRKFDYIHAAAFFHLFSWDEQVEAMSRAISLLKQKPGSILFGRQTGVGEAGEIKHPATRSGSMWRHDVESLRQMVSLVGEKIGVRFSADVTGSREGESAGRWSVLRFVITLA